MKKDHKSDSEILRKKAEELLEIKKNQSDPQFSEPDMLKLVHELQVHQIELEMQNEELLIAKEQAELAKEKYTELYDFAPSGFLSLSEKGEIIKINFSAARMLGKERSLLTKNRFEFFVSINTRSIFNNFLLALFSSKKKQTCELSISFEENLPIDVIIEGAISQSEDTCFLTMVNISERKKNQDALIIAKEKAEESDQLKSAFLANMSHEIRTPMNGILGFTDLLKTPNLSSEKLQDYISIIEKSGDRLLNIINDIMSISKIEANLMEVNMSEVNVNEQIDYIYSFFKPEVEGKGMQFLIKNSLSLEQAVIKTDREKLLAILTNLVKNAIKYSKKGSIEIGCNIRDEYLKFYVKDSGIGIDSDRLEAIFERFIQADISDKQAHQGAGLGLAISKSYVEMLGGKLRLESEKGQGSIFFFTIPKST